MEGLALERDLSTAIISALWGITDGSHFLLSSLWLWGGGCLHLRWTDSKKNIKMKMMCPWPSCHRVHLCLLKMNNRKRRFGAEEGRAGVPSQGFLLVLSVEAVWELPSPVIRIKWGLFNMSQGYERQLESFLLDFCVPEGQWVAWINYQRFSETEHQWKRWLWQQVDLMLNQIVPFFIKA